MKCAHELGGSKLKRVVLLGSAVAVLNSYEDMSVAGKDYTEKDWNPVWLARLPSLSYIARMIRQQTDLSQVTAEQAIKENSVILAYNAGKKLAEQAAWKFMKEKKPTFDLAVINPDIIIGPMLQKVPGPNSVNETNMFAIYNFLNGTYKDIEDVKFPFYDFVRFSQLFAQISSSDEHGAQLAKQHSQMQY